MQHIHIWVSLLLCLGILITTQLVFMSMPLNRWDEGYATAFAQRMLDGSMLPYVDAVSHRGPVFYWLTSALVWLFGFGSWMSVRIGALMALVLTATFTFAALKRVGQPFAAAIFVLVFTFMHVVEMDLQDGSAFGSESVAAMFASAAFWLVVRALDRNRKTPSQSMLAGAGVLLMLGALSKQVGLVLFFSMGPWIVAAIFSRPGMDLRRRLATLAAFVGGALTPFVLVVLIYAAAGELQSLYYYSVTYNTDVYMDPFPLQEVWNKFQEWTVERRLLLAMTAPVLVWAIALPFARARSLRGVLESIDDEGLMLTVALSVVATLMAVHAPARDFYHYYVSVIPWAGLMIGILVARLVGRESGNGRTIAIQSAVLVPIFAIIFIGLSWRGSHFASEAQVASNFAARCKPVEAHSEAGESLFIWGFKPHFYTICNRKPASRFVYTTFLSGTVPWVASTEEEDERRTVPRSRELLISDLEESKPPVILDFPFFLGQTGRRMHDYEIFDNYLKQEYCVVGNNGPVLSYVRRTEDGSCPKR